MRPAVPLGSRRVNGIVVGVDDSDSSKAALRWAIEEARLRGVPVHAVHSWETPIVPPMADVGPVPAGPFLDLPVFMKEMKRAAEELAERVVSEVADEASGVEVRAVAVEGRPASALVDAAQGADLVVVGSRGLGGVKGMLLGSVSHAVASHAPCPVVIHRATPS
jgi:nucleotide-binding universal stress UspA family protein